MTEQAADRDGTTAAELVRSGALTHVAARLEAQLAAALSPGHLALVEATWRSVHLLATTATRHLPSDDIDDLVGAAHHAMLETMHRGPHRTVPDQAPATGDRPRHNTAGRGRKAAPGHRLFQLLTRERPQAVPPRTG